MPSAGTRAADPASRMCPAVIRLGVRAERCLYNIAHSNRTTKWRPRPGLQSGEDSVIGVPLGISSAAPYGIQNPVGNRRFSASSHARNAQPASSFVAGRVVRLRLRHRLMRRAPRPKAEARLGECPVPVCLQHLHHCLLDEAVEHRRNAERPFATRRLRYLDTPYRLRLIGAVKQLSPDRGPVLL
jgi:hypothetical protein